MSDLLVGLAVIGAYYGYYWWRGRQRKKEREENWEEWNK